MFETTICPVYKRAKGFHVTFTNGLTISVQYGWGNYCEHKNTTQPPHHSEDAEICVFDKRNAMVKFKYSGDSVKGYCTPEQVAEAIYYVSIARDIDDAQKLLND